MVTYENIQQLNQQFTKGELGKVPDTITIGDVEFRHRNCLFPDDMTDASSGKPFVQLYNAFGGKSHDRIALVWKMKSELSIHPLVAKTIGKYRGGNTSSAMHEAATATKNKAKAPEEPVIGSQLEIVIVSLNNNSSIMGKVDTGATISSLHAENINIRKDPLNPEQQVVDFVVDGTKYTTSLEQQQSVQSADGGIEYRPLVKFNVKYDGKLIQNVIFNLNDRSHMDHKLLIGMNLLSEIGYKIDPTKESEEFSDEDHIITEDERQWIMEQIMDSEEIQLESVQEQKVRALYEFLVQQDVSFSNLLKFVKVHTIQVVEGLE